MGNALVHIVRCYPTFGRIQLVKTIFIADLVHSNLCETLMFPSKYQRLPYGPASLLAMDITRDIGRPQPFLDITQAANGYKQYTYVPKVNENLSDIQAYQLEILDTAASFVQSKERATEISEFTHKFSLWKDVEPNAIIPDALFQLNEEERFLLFTGSGISLTPFAQKFSRAIRDSPTATKLEEILPELAYSYPEDPHWDEWLDAYLAWDSAMMFSCRKAPDMLADLCAKGLNLVAGITCSGVNPERFRDVATKYERYFNQICETVSLKEERVMSDAEEASVNSVMQAARCELGLNE